MTDFHTVNITDIYKETKDTVVVEFDIPKQLQENFSFKQGQHLTLRKMINDEDVRRSYSLCSSPLDNQWKGSIKQRIATALSPAFLLKRFSHIWIPGKPQYEYAKRLGFKEQNIINGVYSADVNTFNDHYINNLESKQKKFPRKLLFVGRYNEIKGIKDLWNVFIEIQSDKSSNWELWCLGTGDLDAEAPKHSQIKHFGFIQPGDMERFIKDTGVFILPSRFEPWGVALHEFAAAGFPLVCSKEVGSAYLFLKDGKNGYLHKPGDRDSLKTALVKIMNHSDEELLKMAEISVENAKQITPEKWADTLMSILND